MNNQVGSLNTTLTGLRKNIAVLEQRVKDAEAKADDETNKRKAAEGSVEVYSKRAKNERNRRVKAEAGAKQLIIATRARLVL